MSALIQNAKTPQEHMKLAAYYNFAAGKLEADAQHHEGISDLYRNHPAILGSKRNIPLTSNANHCTGIAKSLRDAANEDRQIAAEHEAMAKAAQ